MIFNAYLQNIINVEKKNTCVYPRSKLLIKKRKKKWGEGGMLLAPSACGKHVSQNSEITGLIVRKFKCSLNCRRCRIIKSIALLFITYE